MLATRRRLSRRGRAVGRAASTASRSASRAAISAGRTAGFTCARARRRWKHPATWLGRHDLAWLRRSERWMGLRTLGVEARYRPRNDIEVDGRKLDVGIPADSGLALAALGWV